MDAALDQLRAEGFNVRDEDVARLSPLGHEHINMLGRYAFTLPEPWPVMNCDRSTARPPCLMMLESEFLLRCYSDPDLPPRAIRRFCPSHPTGDRRRCADPGEHAVLCDRFASFALLVSR
jgi:hypothetical protein